MSVVTKKMQRERRHSRIRSKVSGTPERPRFCVSITANHIYCQFIDDVNGKTLASSSTLTAAFKAGENNRPNMAGAARLGEMAAEAALAANVKEVVFVSRETAMENFIAERTADGGDEDYSDLTPSVFRNRYVVYLVDLSMMDRTDDAIKAVNGIAETNASRELSRWFISFRNVVTVVSVVLIVILFVVSVFIMQNTIKLATFSRREEIGIMKMVGASNSFIRCPFVVEGLILGLLGGVIAFSALWGIYELACKKVAAGMFGSILMLPGFETIMYPILIIYLVIGFIVGTFGSNIAIRNYLKV